jgi:hypothetical protein
MPPIEYVGTYRAQGISGLSACKVLQEALVGRIKHRITPDGRPVFAIRDLEAIRAEKAQSPVLQPEAPATVQS